mgnify:CR=1 FL=1|jgi:DNA-binding transcriptional regulator YhcF (GntR family)
MEKLVKSQNGQWKLVKAAPKLDRGHSVFTMDHVNEVSKMKDHAKAKEHAHKIVDASNAQPHNKASIKNMIDKSRNVNDLARGMSNHILAHPSEGLRVVKEEGDELVKAAPKLDRGHSVFIMDHVNEVSKMKDHAKAKEYAHKIVDSSNAQPHNKASIKNMIDKSRNVNDLARGMSNHILAHPSEGLRVVKEEGDNDDDKQNAPWTEVHFSDGPKKDFSYRYQAASHLAAKDYQPDGKAKGNVQHFRHVKDPSKTASIIHHPKDQGKLVKAAPKSDRDHSVFTMDHVDEVSKMKDHAKAKEHAHKIVDSSGAQSHDKASIKNMIDESLSVNDLARGMSNHILAHRVPKDQAQSVVPNKPVKDGKKVRIKSGQNVGGPIKETLRNKLEEGQAKPKPDHMKEHMKEARRLSRINVNEVKGSFQAKEAARELKEKGRRIVEAEKRSKYFTKPEKPTKPEESPKVIRRKKEDMAKALDEMIFNLRKAVEEDHDSEMMFSQLEAIAHHIEEIREVMSSDEDSPDWVKAKITEASKQLSDVAHYIQGKKA